MKPLLVFDMDGVLVEVRESYREAIIQTVAKLGGPRLTQRDVQVCKSRGGFNNDWVASWTLLKENGIDVPYQTVIDTFQSLYLGANEDGLMLRERWFPRDGLLDRLELKYHLALFTGRLRAEAQWALRHFGCPHTFDPFIAMEDVTVEKPDPEGLLKIRELTGASDLTYIGDTGDDLRAANGAGVRFIGIAAPDLPDREVLLQQFRNMGAAAIVDDINSLEEVL